MSFGSMIRDARVASNLSPEQAGKRIGITGASWRRYENEEVYQPKHYVVVNIAQQFGLDLNVLLAAAHYPAVADQDGAARRKVMADIQSLLADQPVERVQAVPQLVRAALALV